MQHEEEVGTEDNLDPSGHANVDGADASDPADDALQVGISHMAGRVYRKQILAKLEREDLHASAPRNTHDKLMADARKRVLKHLKALDIKQAAKKEELRSNISDVLRRYQTNAMNESYENVYGKKVEKFGAF